MTNLIKDYKEAVAMNDPIMRRLVLEDIAHWLKSKGLTVADIKRFK